LQAGDRPVAPVAVSCDRERAMTLADGSNSSRLSSIRIRDLRHLMYDRACELH